jgi:hypothetical protein
MPLPPAYEPPPPPPDADPRYEFGGPLPSGPPPSKGRAARGLGLLLALFLVAFCVIGASIIIAVENANDVPRAPRLEQVDDPAREGPE